MIEGAQNAAAVFTFRDLRRNPSVAPGGPLFSELVRQFLPAVFGFAQALVPENPAAAKTIAIGVFETFAFRWRSASRKTALISWFARTIHYAATRERCRLGLKAKAATPQGLLTQRLLRELIRLKPKYAAPLLLRDLLQERIDVVAVVVGSSPARTEKRIAVAARKVGRRLAKFASNLTKTFPNELAQLASPPDVPAMLRGLNAAVPPEEEALILACLQEWKPKAPRSEIVRETISAWRWLAFGLFVRRVGRGLAIFVLTLVLFGVYMSRPGGQAKLMRFFIAFDKINLRKEFPGIDAPGRPWPTSPRDSALVDSKPPNDAADLYRTTNIWLAKITMTPKEWSRVQPLSVQPVRQVMENGRVKLLNPNASRNGLAGSLGYEFPWSEGTFEFAGKNFGKVGVRFRGNGTYIDSLYGSKQSYKVDLNRVAKKQNLAGMTTLNLLNSVADFTYMKDALGEKLFRELGAIGPRTSYAYLTLDAPPTHSNQALGLYVMVEDIDGNFAKDRFGSKSTPIFKPVTYDLFKYLGNDWKSYARAYDLKTKATQEQLARVMEFARIVTEADDKEFARKLPEFLDLEEFAAFVAGHVVLSSYDGYLSNGQNFYMYLHENKFGFIPWDQDHGWGEFGFVATNERREDANIWQPAAYDNKFLNRCLKVESFRKEYRKKLEEAMAGPFTVENLYREIDQLAARLRPAVAAESDFRLERFDKAISTTWLPGPRDGDMNSNKVIGPRAPIHQIKRFIVNRTKSVRDQLDGKSEGTLISGFAASPPPSESAESRSNQTELQPGQSRQP